MNGLLRSEILREAHAGTVNLEPRWLKVDAAVSYSGISRAVLYRILAEGKIRSSSLRSRGALRGIRLIIEHRLTPTTDEEGKGSDMTNESPIGSSELRVLEGRFQGSLNTGRQRPRVRMISNHNGGEERI